MVSFWQMSKNWTAFLTLVITLTTGWQLSRVFWNNHVTKRVYQNRNLTLKKYMCVFWIKLGDVRILFQTFWSKYCESFSHLTDTPLAHILHQHDRHTKWDWLACASTMIVIGGGPIYTVRCRIRFRWKLQWRTQQDYYGRRCVTLLYSYCTGTYTEATVLLLWGNAAVTMEYPHSYSVGVPAWVLQGSIGATSKKQQCYFIVGTSAVNV